MSSGPYKVEPEELPWADDEADASVEVFWRRTASRVCEWLDQQHVAPRNAVVLLPFAQHLTLARKAFAHLGAWPPRLETTRSLAASLAPPALARPGQLSGDAAADTLAALQLLRKADLVEENDTRSSRLRAQRVLALAQALRQSADALAPSERSLHWRAAHEELGRAGAEPLEQQLALQAVLWAQLGPEPATDALFACQADAWVALEAGRPDPLARAVLARASKPALLLTLAPPSALRTPDWRQQVLPDDSALAQAVTAHILHAVARAETPVLLPASDRALVRHVMALLAPYGLVVVDETGGSLATQGPAAALRHLVQAALQHSMDDALAWARSPLGPDSLEGLAALEGWARRYRHASWQGLAPDQAPQQAWRRLADACAPLRTGPARRPLRQWLDALKQTLMRCKALSPERWPAEQQASWLGLCETLWLSRSPWPGSALEASLGLPLTSTEWAAWLDDALQAPAPAADAGGPPQLVVTPLSRALLRPFGHVVVAGCDEARWALGAVAPALVSQASAKALGLPHRDAALATQWQGLAQALRWPRATWLHAAQAQGVHLEWATVLQRLRALWGGTPWGEAPEVRLPQQAHAQPMPRQQQACSGWLPTRLSASQAEALRDCPYRYFGRARLGLGEDAEIDIDPDQRDWGRWLHAVLEAAHAMGDPAAHWHAACAQVISAQGLPLGAEAPFLALLQRWGPAYLAWWAEQTGAQVLARERRLQALPWADDPLLAAITWTGVIDRLDADAQGRLHLLDFKTGSASTVKDKLGDDTQLPFYTLLLAMDGDVVDSAAYLAYEAKSRSLKALASPDVIQHAERLRLGLAADFHALHAGEPLRALGEGRLCELCDMRGLCRRDDWQEGLGT